MLCCDTIEVAAGDTTPLIDFPSALPAVIVKPPPGYFEQDQLCKLPVKTAQQTVIALTVVVYFLISVQEYFMEGGVIKWSGEIERCWLKREILGVH